MISSLCVEMKNERISRHGIDARNAKHGWSLGPYIKNKVMNLWAK
jgi:hypothetical protein